MFIRGVGRPLAWGYGRQRQAGACSGKFSRCSLLPETAVKVEQGEVEFLLFFHSRTGPGVQVEASSER